MTEPIPHATPRLPRVVLTSERLRQGLAAYEQQYGLPSAEFYRRFARGTDIMGRLEVQLRYTPVGTCCARRWRATWLP